MTPLTDEQAAQDVILFKALANTVRLQIVSLVAASLEGQVSAGQIVAKFSLSQPTISHHLKILRDAGVLTAHKASTFVFYRFTPQLQDAVASLLPSRPVSTPPIQWVSTVRHRPAVSSAQAHAQREFPPNSPMSAPSFTAAVRSSPLEIKIIDEDEPVSKSGLASDGNRTDPEVQKQSKQSKQSKRSKSAESSKPSKEAKRLPDNLATEPKVQSRAKPEKKAKSSVASPKKLKKLAAKVTKSSIKKSTKIRDGKKVSKPKKSGR
ncbi:MAG: metalloregulator ArsR/SmtB family transcription factor [Antricoccus sp.]